MTDNVREGQAWQLNVWDRMAEVYQAEIDSRFRPVIEQVLERAELEAGHHVLDLGTGTGALAIGTLARIGPTGRVTAVDISPEMLERAQATLDSLDISNVELVEGRAEEIPSESESVDRVLASLSMMYVIEREAAAREIARVLRPGGRFVAAVWAGPDAADIVQFQQTAGSFAPTPPVPGVGPGALADPAPFLAQLEAAGLEAHCEAAVTSFHFASFDEAWDALAGVTTAALDAEVREQARSTVKSLMWADGQSTREFRNRTLFICATKTG